ncbi:hypothetical protein [Reinekea thalattae]|uniref:Uncharacterized protein n=1 Tax=Reinekea thalattae TaxID=2593301 RepID=A0A5C8Z266_9GAMM|nr:hypothetical protein [Reinekea thalattae]TXR51394.1 hypothetical protein FME95_12765 [Reinekea thalattae]
MHTIVNNSDKTLFYHGEYRNKQLTIYSADGQFEGSFEQDNRQAAWVCGVSFDETLQSLRSAVDEYHYFRLKQRKQNSANSLPTHADYVAALNTILPLLNASQQQLLAQLQSSPDYQCDVDLLLSVAELHSTIQLLLSYAAIAQRLSDELAFIPMQEQPILDPVIGILMTPTGILANRANYDDARTLQLKPEVALALEDLNGHRFT